MLTSLANPVRNQAFEAQIEYHHLDINKRTLQRGLKTHTNQGQRYKQARVSKPMSVQNRRKRVEYAQKHLYSTIENYWQWIIFTDKAHFDSTAQKTNYILREAGTRYEPENI